MGKATVMLPMRTMEQLIPKGYKLLGMGCVGGQVRIMLEADEFPSKELVTDDIMGEFVVCEAQPCSCGETMTLHMDVEQLC